MVQVFILYEDDIDEETIVNVYENEQDAINAAKRLKAEHVAKGGSNWKNWHVDSYDLIPAKTRSIRDTCR